VLKNQMNNEHLKRVHEQELSRLPKKAVKPGDAWEQVDDVDLGSGQMLKMERRYEYLGTEQRGGRQLDKIGITDKRVVSLDLPANPLVPIKVSNVNLDVAESKGTLYFDRERGLDASLNHLMHLKGKLTLTIGEQELPTDLDLKIEGTQKLKE
jgi:hypothetical protein